MRNIYALLIFVVFLAFSSHTEAQTLKENTQQLQTEQASNVIYPVRAWVTKPLRELTQENPWREPDFTTIPWVSPDRKNRPRQTFIYSAADGPEYGNDSSIIQTKMGTRDATQSTKALIKNWAGIQSSSYPPDPTGAVGPNHYIQSVNATTVRIFDKNGNTLESFLMGTIFGETSNAGDPIIMYDRFADRWFVSQFGDNNEIFIAISQTADPTGSYYAYEYVSPQFPDYLKFSIWHDGYYMTSNQSTDKVYVFERDLMLTGNSGARAIYQTFTTGSVSGFFVPLPADAADNHTLPAAGTPLPFFAYYDNAWGGGNDGIKIWTATTNWTAGTLTISATPTQVNTNAFDASYDQYWDDVPQPNGVELDGIGGVLMYRAPWRSWSGYNNVILTWGVKISESPRQRAIMWCELRQISGTWSVYQQGIYAPDTHTRWMSSATMDDNGSIGLCYAKSSTTIYPGLFYTGRLAGDPLGTMTLTETQAIAGTGSQSTYNRFGDYAQTSLDPDGITFWHTGEYVTTSSGQETRIYSFQIPAGPLAPVANFTADATAPFCTGTVQFTDQSTNTPTSWLWNFGDGQTSTLQSPSHTYAASGTYTVSLKATNAIGNNTMTKTSYITISLPSNATATGAARCGTGTVTLTATGANTLKWYDAATGGNLLGTGTSFTTPSISTTTTYYVENNIPSSPANVGPAVGGASRNIAAILYFDVYQPMTLISVQARAQTTGVKTITLLDNTGATVYTANVTVNNSVTTITLNWVIQPGSGYQLLTLENSALYRISSGVSYPYTAPGLCSITGCDIGSDFYYSWFNWNVQGLGCGSTRVPAVATINPTVTPSVAVTPSATNICSGTGVTFTATPSNGGTPSYQWKVNGNNVGSNSQTFTSSALSDGDVITCTMTSTESCASPATATSSGITMTVNPVVTPTVSVAASASTICDGNSVTFTATPSNGGTPTYQWKLNGNNVGTGGTTYTNSGLNDGDIVSCVMTSTEVCTTTGTANSNPVTMVVNPNVIPSVAVSESQNNICFGSNVTFTASPTNGGTPAYQWYLNSNPVASNSATYSNAALNDGDEITCVMTSTAACASPSSVSSTPVTMTVNSVVTPSVSVNASSTSICDGTNVTFTASPVNGGTPTYQWLLNGNNVGSGGTTYSNASLNDGDVITCIMTSTETCASPTSVTSLPVSMSVSAPVTPSVAVSASETNICSGTSVTFNATPTNGGTPTYQWQVNGSNVGTGASYTNASLNDGDEITCIMTSTAACATPETVTSAPVNMTVNTTLTPSVMVSASATTICSGSSVTFSATPTNGGTPSYQWYLNGSPTGINSANYSNNALNDGDVITCEMTSSETCASPVLVVSSPVTITVSSSVTPSVSVNASSTNICSGTAVTFTATPTNGGTPAYQWYLNGSPTGINSATYNNATLNDGDEIICVMTSTESCASPTFATSAPVTMTVSSTLTPAVSVAASATSICSGNNVTFTANPVNGGTPTYQWYHNGSPVGGNSATYNNSGLNNGDEITCVMTSTELCASPATATSAPVIITVNSTLTPAVSVAASATSICSGTDVAFTANPVNGGTPTYQWYLNGSPVGGNSATYNNSGLNNGDEITCVMTSTETCASPTTATSAPVTMIVNTSVTPSVAINASANNICSGTSVTFTATPTNGGTPVYQWYLNSNPVGLSSATYSNALLADGDVISCMITSTETCATPSTATSAPVVMTVNANVTPSVSITPSATNICSGSEITFTANPVNGGTPSYQWLLNGSVTGTNSPVYSSSTLNNGDIVTCTMTSTETCADPVTAVSSQVAITVSTSVTPTVAINASATSICEGTSVLFTATPVNGGTPAYQWKINGSNVGGNSATFNSTSLNNGDVITCEMTSTETCANPASVTSGSITMTVTPSVTPLVSIAASTNGICYGTPVTFTATPTNGGTPSYQWILNGANVGSNSPNYTSSMLQNSDIISCIMISNVSCATATTVNSNDLTMIVNPSVSPSVSIVSSENGVCEGTPITFTAAPVNGGTPSYQWLVNGANVGSNMSTFTSTTLTDGDVVSCVISSTAPCVSPVMATSNTIVMNLYPNLTPSVDIASQPTGTICPGTAKEFTAVATNGGTSPTFEWFVDGVSVGTGSTLSGTYSNGQVITCTMTSTQPCVMPAIVDANPITVSTFTVTPVTISDNAGTLTSSATYGNQWYEVNSGVVVGAIGQSFTPLTDGVYYVIVTDANGCTATSNQIEFILEGIDENGAATVTFFPNPTSGNLTVTFNKAFNNGTLKVENAIGELVLEKSINQAAGSVFTVDFSTYAPGSYFIIVKDAENEIREQVIYEK